MAGTPNWLRPAGRVAAFVGLLALAAAYSYVVWRGSAYAWNHGIHFEGTEQFNLAAMRDAVHVLALVIGVFLFPGRAGLTKPALSRGGWALRGYVVVAALAALTSLVNALHPFFSNPFARRGPFFFTLGPVAWELLWPGLAYGFALECFGRRKGGVLSAGALGVLVVAGTAWYLPVFASLRPLDAIGFAVFSFALSLLSLELRRRTGSILPGLAGHVVVKFLLSW